MSLKVGDRVMYVGGYSSLCNTCGTVTGVNFNSEIYLKFDDLVHTYIIPHKYLAKIGSFSLVYSFTRLYTFGEPRCT